MVDRRHAAGRRAERVVGEWLIEHGWQILGERLRSDLGEIDLLALDGQGCLVGVEVRLRQSGRAGDAAESVRPRHLRRVRAALRAYARERGVPHAGLRVDLVAVGPGPQPRTWRLTRLPAIDGW